MGNEIRAIVSILAFVVMVFLAACSGQNPLDRSQAESLINQSDTMTQTLETIRFTDEGFSAGQAQGYWGQNGQILKSQDDIRMAEQYKIAFSNRISRTVHNVTGLAEIPGSEGKMYSAEFTWDYDNLPSIARRFVMKGGEGEARLRLYDDGWRVSNVDLDPPSIHFELSAREMEEALKDLNETQDRLRQEAEARARVTREYQQKVIASRISGGAVQKISFQPYKQRRQQVGEIRLTDVSFAADGFNRGSSQYTNRQHFFFDAFQPKRTDHGAPPPSSGCYGRSRNQQGPQINLGYERNATWGYSTWVMQYVGRCTQFWFQFEDETQRNAAANKLATAINSWAARHRDVVNVPANYSVPIIEN